MTSHRVLWLYRIPGGGGEAYFVDLSAVEEVETKRGLVASMASKRPVFVAFNARGASASLPSPAASRALRSPPFRLR